MKPPPWTDDERGVELLAPPVCRRCEPWREGAGVEGRWGSVGTGDDDGSEEVGWAEAGGEELSRRFVMNKPSGNLGRITEERGGARREMGQESSVKRKRSAGAGSRAVGKKRRGDDDSGDSLWPAGDVPYEGRRSSEDSGRYIDANTIDTAVREESVYPSADDDPAPASTPTTYDPPSDDEPDAHSISPDALLLDREPLLPPARAIQPPPRPSPPTGPTSPQPATALPPRPTTTLPQATTTRPSPQPLPTPPTSLLTRLSTLLARHLLRRRPRSSPPLLPHCAGCRLPLVPAGAADVDTHTSGSVRGPFNTRYHARCMRCTACERVLEGGTSWFELDEEGRVEVLCRRCWREGRIGRGWAVERVDFEEMGLGFVG